MTAATSFEPVSIAKLAADAASVSAAGYVLLRVVVDLEDGRDFALHLEVHDDGTVIPPDGWEILAGDGMITGVRHTDQPAANGHLRRRQGRQVAVAHHGPAGAGDAAGA